MPPGARKSPFIGKTEPLEGVLYPRYVQDVTKAFTDPKQAAAYRAAQAGGSPSASKKGKKQKPQPGTFGRDLHQLASPPAESAAAPEKPPKKRRRKSQPDGPEVVSDNALEGTGVRERQTTEAPDTNGFSDATEGGQLKKKKRSKKKGANLASEGGPSGPGNAEEAEHMRSIMGIASGAAPVQRANGFSFGFEAANGGAAASTDSEPEGDAAGVQEARAVEGSILQKRQPNSAAAVVPPRNFHAYRSNEQRLQDKLQRVMGAGAAIPRRVFIGGMPFHFEEEDVREYWSYCGEIEDLSLVRFPDTGRFKGIAFVTFAEDAGYEEALACNGIAIDEHTIKVEPCTSAGAKGRLGGEQRQAAVARQHTAPAPKTPGYHVAYVGNVAFEAAPEQLRNVFEGCDVSFVRLHTDKETGKSKGFAHVHFGDEASLDRAMEYDGVPLLGRKIKVGFAQPKKQ